jgi:twitching motility protein PilJ
VEEKQMTSDVDYTQLYEQAHTAYLESNYQEAAALLESLIRDFPDDPNALLLRGHVYLGLQQYQSASEQYEAVLRLSEQPELVEYAQRGLEQARQGLEIEGDSEAEVTGFNVNGSDYPARYAATEDTSFNGWREDSNNNAWDRNALDDEIDWNSQAFDEEDSGEPTVGQVPSLDSTQDSNLDTNFEVENDFGAEQSYNNPFDGASRQDTVLNWQDSAQDMPDYSFEGDEDDNYSASNAQEIEDPTFMVGANSSNNRLHPSDETQENFSLDADENDLTDNKSDNFFSGDVFSEPALEQSGYAITSAETQEDFLDMDSLPDDGLEDITRFGLNDMTADFGDSELFVSTSEDLNSSQPLSGTNSSSLGSWGTGQESAALGLAGVAERYTKPTVEVSQGRLAKFLNAPFKQKQWAIAGAAGLTSALAVLITLGIASATASGDNAKRALSPLSGRGLLMTLVTSAATLGTTAFLGQLAAGQERRSADDLQNQFDAMMVGNFNVKATVYSEDELGQLSAKFNQMAQVIATTTTEAQRRATEMEQAKEDLQRQVIRLLDDVEGAARGDLTVEAEVTADVLGAVADAFNLTIQNLREIVFQVKNAAKQVNKGSTDSELFARNQSSDALRMAEELAVTLNSVQMMTESIQRVAENAREAEEVARSSSVTALKGGEAVERTVAGILQIRETVSETARKVKRLAEASQEISKIVALISQIASRTNLLALNASIQAARAGEAGRGFAIVADEVRQLADRSAKSLKEIEHIVLQIQSETGSVMTAMEEGIQQVIDVTDKSEQAKRSLEDIIEVSNRIDTLVRSITADTVKQRENSRSVAQVMQTVELTAQETSQESQRVAGSLQTLVSISRELLTSVERFRVEKGEG